MKPEYRKEKNEHCYYKIFSKRKDRLKVLEVDSDSIMFGYYWPEWMEAYTMPCTEDLFYKKLYKVQDKITIAVMV